jgi:hypothetical protein
VHAAVDNICHINPGRTFCNLYLLQKSFRLRYTSSTQKWRYHVLQGVSSSLCNVYVRKTSSQTTHCALDKTSYFAHLNKSISFFASKIDTNNRMSQLRDGRMCQCEFTICSSCTIKLLTNQIGHLPCTCGFAIYQRKMCKLRVQLDICKFVFRNIFTGIQGT